MSLADHIENVLERGTPAQRKALIEQLVHEIQIVGPAASDPSTASHAETRTPNQAPTTAPRFAQWATWWAILGSNQ